MADSPYELQDPKELPVIKRALSKWMYFIRDLVLCISINLIFLQGRKFE